MNELKRLLKHVAIRMIKMHIVFAVSLMFYFVVGTDPLLQDPSRIVATVVLLAVICVLLSFLAAFLFSKMLFTRKNFLKNQPEGGFLMYGPASLYVDGMSIGGYLYHAGRKLYFTAHRYNGIYSDHKQWIPADRLDIEGRNLVVYSENGQRTELFVSHPEKWKNALKNKDIYN